MLAEAELHSEIEALRERNRELESDLKRAEGQCEVLENFVFGIEQEYEKAQRELTSAKRELSASLEDVRKKEAVVRALGTPILDIWDDVIVLPIIGAVDPDRATTMTEALLSRIVARRARCVIVDLTGVEQVDTSTAEHLLRLLHSTRLLGAFAVLTGIGPQIAATIADLGIDFGSVRTLRTLREGLRVCMARLSNV